MQTLAPSMESYELVPVIWASKPSTGEDWARSSALPCGMPSAMSNSTTSPSCFSPMRCASVPPIWPAPINAILLRAMEEVLREKPLGTADRAVVNFFSRGVQVSIGIAAHNDHHAICNTLYQT